MRRALIAVAVTALMGGLVVAPVTEQTARAGFSGLKPAGTVPSGNLITLVRRGGGGHGGGHGGGGHRGGHVGGGGHHGGGHAYRGGGHRGGSHAYRGRGGYRGGGHVYRGGRGHYKGRHYSAPKHYYRRGGRHKHYTYKNYKYRRYGPYYRNYGWYGGGYAYGYGGCAWLRRQALITGSSYWWQRYYDCIYY